MRDQLFTICSVCGAEHYGYGPHPECRQYDREYCSESDDVGEEVGEEQEPPSGDVRDDDRAGAESEPHEQRIDPAIAEMVERHRKHHFFEAYYGPDRQQAYEFMTIADRRKLYACEVFDLCRLAGLEFTEMGTWWGIRFPDSTGFIIPKLDLDHSREALAADIRKAKEKAGPLGFLVR